MKGVPADVKAAAAAAAKAQGKPAGNYAIKNTRSAVDPVLTFADNRALREKVYRAFVNRGDNGGANDTNAIIAADREAARRPRQAARLRQPCRLADAGHDGQVARQGDGPDDARLAGRRSRASPRKSRDMQALADKSTAQAQDRAVGLSLLHGEGPQGPLRPQPGRDQAVLRAVEHDQRHVLGRASSSTASTFKENTGTVPVFHPDVRTFEVTNAGRRASSACCTSTIMPATGSARARGPTPIAAARPARRQDRARVEQ